MLIRFGFGVTGSRSSGVIVKYIAPGSVADRNKQLKCGDHILQIGNRNLRGLGCEQVAVLIRQCYTNLKMIVARPIVLDSYNLSYEIDFHLKSVVVPTRRLFDLDEFDKLLDDLFQLANLQRDESILILKIFAIFFFVFEVETPETEQYTISLRKNSRGIGITVAGYVCEKKDLRGIFVKKIAKNSAADLVRRIEINDRIIKVNEVLLNDLTNFEAIGALKRAGSEIDLTFERYNSGPKFDNLQNTLNCPDRNSISSSNVTSLSWFTIDFESGTMEPMDSMRTLSVEHNFDFYIDPNFQGEIPVNMDDRIRDDWSSLIDTDQKIIIVHIWKSSSLGICLEGTVDVENGIELHARHFIRSILPNGPIAKCGKLQVGDELLEVNRKRLRGIQHTEVVRILKDLPKAVHLVCTRNSRSEINRAFYTSPNYEHFETRNLLTESCLSTFNLYDRLIQKANSETSVNTMSTTNEIFGPKSKSLTTINYLAQWEDAVELIELEKNEHSGLGFSVLDYQDPMEINKTVIVVRALIPKGAAELDGRLKPGDKLCFVNDFSLENVSLNFAVKVFRSLPFRRVQIGICKPLQTD